MSNNKTFKSVSLTQQKWKAIKWPNYRNRKNNIVYEALIWKRKLKDLQSRKMQTKTKAFKHMEKRFKSKTSTKSKRPKNEENKKLAIPFIANSMNGKKRWQFWREQSECCIRHIYELNCRMNEHFEAQHLSFGFVKSTVKQTSNRIECLNWYRNTMANKYTYTEQWTYLFWFGIFQHFS